MCIEASLYRVLSRSVGHRLDRIGGRGVPVCLDGIIDEELAELGVVIDLRRHRAALRARLQLGLAERAPNDRLSTDDLAHALHSASAADAARADREMRV